MNCSSPVTNPIIEGRNLKVVRGGDVILHVPSLTVQAGEVLAVIGPNGAGKTTLLQTLAYLVNPFEGELWFQGRKVGEECPVLEYRRVLSMAFQEPLLFDTTVFENVASGLKIRGLKKSEITRIVLEYLDLFGILQLRSRSARSLSGGEAQRTNLARAFATNPEVILLDEPFASLDPKSREPLIEDMKTILKKTKTTAAFVTHDLVEALRLSDRMLVMNRGTISQIGSSEEVMNKPRDESVAGLVGIGTILSGHVLESRNGAFKASVGGKEVEAMGDFHVGEMVDLFIRPENVTISVGSDHAKTSARNIFPGIITNVTPMGFYWKIHLDCGFPLISYVTLQSLEGLQLVEGRHVVASFKATAIHATRKSPVK
ncbi:MAG: Fe(3+) ions import ATP-binding protein FbpC 2 [Syntrophorhabdaceae bacterium PtaU1.Bin034]|nr:MAG: Fe(3+) ions import ATP-binding protein FbpC 2 [Syntrophorhabdaceae bacterium PtaU1.Bin034]